MSRKRMPGLRQDQLTKEHEMCIHKLYFGTTCVECLALQLEDVLRKLVDRVNVVTEDERYKTVWHIHQLHNGPYKGPKYEEEFKAAEKLLKELE